MLRSSRRFTVCTIACLASANGTFGQGVFFTQGGPDIVRWVDPESSAATNAVTLHMDFSSSGPDADWTQSRLCWGTSWGRIYCSDLSGSNVQKVFENPSASIQALTVDPTHHRLYWFQSLTPYDYVLMSAGLDGSSPSAVFSLYENGASMRDIAVDSIRGTVFWTQDDSIRAADLDGNNHRVVVPQSGAGISSIVVHESTGRIYWVQSSPFAQPGIHSAAADGSDLRQVVSGNTYALAIDPVGGKLYWSGPGREFYRVNLDGNGVEFLGAADPSVSASFAVDPASKAMYLATSRQPYVRELQRITPMGPSALLRQEVVNDAVDLAFDPVHAQLYVALSSYRSTDVPRIIRTRGLPGEAAAIVVNVAATHVNAVAVDGSADKLFWGDMNISGHDGEIVASEVWGSDLNGNNMVRLATESGALEVMTVNPGESKVYWGSQNGISRMNYNGTGRTLLSSRSTWGLAIDPLGQKMYYIVADPTVASIYRSNLDGSVEELVLTVEQGTGVPERLTVDADGGKIYWTSKNNTSEGSTQSVYRANINGTAIEIVTSHVSPDGTTQLAIALDTRPVSCERTASFADLRGIPGPDITDVAAVVDCFRDVTGAPAKPLCDLDPCDGVGQRCIGDDNIDVRDITRAIDAFRGLGCR